MEREWMKRGRKIGGKTMDCSTRKGEKMKVVRIKNKKIVIKFKILN
jgi:hypothetical protein